MAFAIKNAFIIPMTSNNSMFIKSGTITVEDGTITDIGPSEKIEIPRGFDVIDGTNKIVIPGMINCHTHAAMTLFRNYADDVPLKEWLEKYIWPAEAKLTPELIYLGAKLAAIEAARFGVTVLNSMYLTEKMEAKAFSEVGIRGLVGEGIFSWIADKAFQRTKELIETWHHAEDDLIRVSIDPHAPYTCDPEVLQKVRELTNNYREKYEKPPLIHIHLAETEDEWKNIQASMEKWETNGIAIKEELKNAEGPVDYLNKLGFLTPNDTDESDVIAAHVVAVTAKEKKILAEKKVRIAHNPISNLKLGSGIAPVPEYLKMNIPVGLGTDGPTLTPLDMIESAKMVALLFKGLHNNPTLITAYDALKMATIDAARVLGWNDKIGSLEKGKDADIVLIDLKKPHLTPIFNPISHVVYSVRSSDVSDVFVKGKKIVENGTILNISVEDLLEKVNQNISIFLE